MPDVGEDARLVEDRVARASRPWVWKREKEKEKEERGLRGTGFQPVCTQRQGRGVILALGNAPRFPVRKQAQG
jgi:hypothetical protein